MIGDGPVIACRILAHKIQSPQEREAIQVIFRNYNLLMIKRHFHNKNLF